MTWPTPQEYNEAVQNPKYAFSDSELRTSSPELTRLGIPRSCAGNFAVVFKMHNATRNRIWAVRCFLTEYADSQERYKFIDMAIRKSNLPYFVDFNYLQKGINVSGKWFPVLKMEWVQGDTLSEYIFKNLNNPNELHKFANNWYKMLDDIRKISIAHGDLQHGNVLLNNGQIKLIDYDGMFVPDFRGKNSKELGHRNYQHPRRSNNLFNSNLDNFSGWIIYASIIICANEPNIWSITQAGDESLLFRQKDFEQPSRSKIFQILQNHTNPQVKMFGDYIKQFLLVNPENVPFLDTIDIDIVKILPGDGSWIYKPEDSETKPSLSTISSTVQTNIESDGELPPKWWEEPTKPEFPPMTFQNNHRWERRSLIITFILAFLPVYIYFPTGLVIIPFVFVVWVYFIKSRFNSDPATKERRKKVEIQTEYYQLNNDILNVGKLIEVKGVELQNIINQIEHLKNEFPHRNDSLKEKQEQNILSNYKKYQETLLEITNHTESLKSEEKRAIEIDTHKQTSEIKQIHDKIDSLKKQKDVDLKVAEAQLIKLKVMLNSLRAEYITLRNSKCGVLESQYRDQQNIISYLKQKIDDERNNILQRIQKDYLGGFLKSALISETHIKGIGSVFEERLAQSGIRSAFDISIVKLQRIQGLGGQRFCNVMDWRDKVEKIAKKNMPSQIPSYKIQEIKSKYVTNLYNAEQESQSLRKMINDIQHQLKNEELNKRRLIESSILEEENKYHIKKENIENKYNGEENNLKYSIAQINEEIKQIVLKVKMDFNHEIDLINQRKINADSIYKSNLAEITIQFSKEYKELLDMNNKKQQGLQHPKELLIKEQDNMRHNLISLNSQVHSLNSELQRFSGINFKSYLWSVILNR